MITNRKYSNVGRGILLVGLFAICFVLWPMFTMGQEKCTEQGPHWTTNWFLDFCPSVNNTPSVTPSSYSCVETESPVPTPAVVPPTYGGGQKEKMATYDCTNTVDHQYLPITYTVSDVYWKPPIPKKFGTSDVPSFSATAYVDVTSSDTNFCSDPGQVPIGSCSWSIVDATPKTASVEIDFGEILSAMSGIAEIAGGGCEFPKTGLKLTVEQTTKNKCCEDGSVGQNIKKKGTLDITGTSVKCKGPYTIGVATVSLFIQCDGSGQISIDTEYNAFAMSSKCYDSGYWCLSIGAGCTVSGGIEVNVIDSDILTAQGGVKGGFTYNGKRCYKNSDDSYDSEHSSAPKFCYSDTTLFYKITMLGGISYEGSLVLAEGSC